MKWMKLMKSVDFWWTDVGCFLEVCSDLNGINSRASGGCHGEKLQIIRKQLGYNDRSASLMQWLERILQFSWLCISRFRGVLFGVSKSSKNTCDLWSFLRIGPSKLGFWWDAVWSCHASLAPGHPTRKIDRLERNPLLGPFGPIGWFFECKIMGIL